MSITPIFIPNSTSFINNPCYLENLFETYQTKFKSHDQSVIISLSYVINAVDTLSVLNFLTNKNKSPSSSDTIYFYWENKVNNEEILGYGATQYFCIDSSDRFFRSKNFIKDCLIKIIRIKEKKEIKSTPRIFSSFTFFEKIDDPHYPFPPALAFLPYVQLIKFKNSSILTFNILIEKKTDIKQTVFNILATKKSILSLKAYQNKKRKSKDIDRLDINLAKIQKFKNSVNLILKSIKNNEFKKLVLADFLDLKNSVNFSIPNCLDNLRFHYPDCYVFAINNGKNHCFIGASPERLLSIKNQKLITDALAGSSSRDKDKYKDYYLSQKLLKSYKERYEHQVVIKYIVKSLLNIGLSPKVLPLKILKLSNIQHLWTPIYSKLELNIHPIDIVATLHPTPAVSGFPTAITCRKIEHYEQFIRGLYAAPLGWIDSNKNSEFIVGIRSALISHNNARVYAGAGIVKGSQSEQELAEIQLKFEGLLKALS
ncbi:isochorismate synthase [Candidatus Atelocyanobacterium thalassae]|uniref:isochorismate synthase n=1 Tax=cyanobacterium endosymbiont of Braarudosphaera bigelowii TaxID=1285375 RepID=A0ABM7U5E3_9CHRO|nr:isochorismate synthase [Candidatus Atelocyanobacterium thalassa]BDA39944.1 salicylate biosynthesis isochorismate synthase [cyanobacterium endosymbiont of Braarudosphaera bigelowii]